MCEPLPCEPTEGQAGGVGRLVAALTAARGPRAG
jgi:hypothetical protein